MSTISNQQLTDTQMHQNISINEAVSQFLMECKIRNLTKETIRCYRNALKKFQQHLKARQMDINVLTTYELTHIIIPGMLDEDLALRTVNCNPCILKEFFKFLTRDG